MPTRRWRSHFTEQALRKSSPRLPSRELFDPQEVGDTMGIEETAETWIRIDLFCDGLENDGTCLFGARDEFGKDFRRRSDVRGSAKGYSQRCRKGALALRSKIAALVVSRLRQRA